MNGVRRAPSPSGASGASGSEGGARRAPHRGLFIVLEGIDGAGKTEQAARLCAWLREQGFRVIETREPTSGEWGLRYRSWARGELEASPKEVLHFFAEDRREHATDVLRPALARGDLVVCDRYRASSWAYQRAQGVGEALLGSELDAPDLPAPDLEIWLRLPVSQALARLGTRASERFERAEFLERVDREYARLGLQEVDASGDTAAVAAEIRSLVAPLLERATRAGSEP